MLPSFGDTLAHFSHKSIHPGLPLIYFFDVNIALGTSQWVLSGEIKKKIKIPHFAIFFQRKRGGPGGYFGPTSYKSL